MAAAGPHFNRALFDFLTDLRANNDRDWFQANKARYETAVKEPILRFINDFGPRLAKISPHVRADPRPVGGSLFRIYRDTRFSKDKSPYKTHAAAQFRHERAKDVHAPGFYLHLEPGNVFMGAGLWHPDTKTTGKIRQAILDDGDTWKRVTRAKAIRERFTMEGGDTLKRAPRGIDPEHPLIEDLKRKDFLVMTRYSEKQACSADFLTRFTKDCRAVSGFVGFLTRAAGLAY